MRRRLRSRWRAAATRAATLTAATLLVAAGLAGAHGRAEAQGASAGDTGDAGDAVAAELAGRWGVDAAAVTLDWGSADAPSGEPERLLGSGAGGVFVAELRTGSGLERRRVRAGVRQTVAVAARDLERGTVLDAADLAPRDTVLWGGPGSGREVAPGWVARRRIGAGAVLAEPAVTPPAAVGAGETVRLVWRGGGLEVSTRATAAGSAGVGERVAVRTESGRRVWGVAESRGTVRIEGGRE